MASISAVDLPGMQRLAVAHGSSIEVGRNNLNTLLAEAQNLAGQYSGDAANRLLTAVGTLHDRGMSLLQAHENMLELVNTTQSSQSNTNDNTIGQAGMAGQIADGAPTGLPGL
jgi:hypothetical protein